MGRLPEDIVIVTGASRGIGFAIAQAMLGEGARVALASKDPARGEAALDDLAVESDRVFFSPTDVTDRAQVQELVAQVTQVFGPPTVLVNNAGVHDKAPFTEESEELWDRMYRVNTLGTVLPSQEVVPLMKQNGGGAIVNIASKAGIVGEPGHTAYSASKGAVIAMTRGMAVELAPFDIRVNAICPGPVATDMLFEDHPTEESQRRLAREAPLGRLGQPIDVAHAAVYLASKESAWCTGQAIRLDGGLSILK